MLVAHPFQIGSELLHETRIIEQERPSLATVFHDGQMLIIEREVEILYVQGESLADSQASLQEQTEVKAITPGGNSFENTLNFATFHASRLRLIEFHPVDLAHGVAVKQNLLLDPGQEACHCYLLACSGFRSQMGMHPEEYSQHLCSDRLHRPLVECTKLGEISCIGAAHLG